MQILKVVLLIAVTTSEIAFMNCEVYKQLQHIYEETHTFDRSLCKCRDLFSCRAMNTYYYIGKNTNQCNYFNVPCCFNPDKDLVERVLKLPRGNGDCGLQNGVHSIGRYPKYFRKTPWLIAVFIRDDLEPSAKNLSRDNLRYHCGGAFIHPEVVLTAAHCVSNTNDHYVVGTHNPISIPKYRHYPRYYNVSKILIHPDFYPKNLMNDIALLILQNHTALYNNYFGTICLTDEVEILERCVARSVKIEKNNFADIKTQSLLIIPQSTCQEQLRKTRLGKYFLLDESFICARGEDYDREICKGDGGSPLQCLNTKFGYRFYQYGIVSWGIECGRKNIPEVYTNVSYFKPWIDQNMKQLGFKTSYYTSKSYS